MSEPMKRPGVGVGVCLFRDDKLLFGLRKSEHGLGTWCFPGGHLELGESWSECARREVLEETGFDIKEFRYMGVTNDIYGPDKHYITIYMGADVPEGDPRIMEPDKCEKWEWFGAGNYPELTFLSTRNFLESSYNPLNFKNT